MKLLKIMLLLNTNLIKMLSKIIRQQRTVKKLGKILMK